MEAFDLPFVLFRRTPVSLNHDHSQLIYVIDNLIKWWAHNVNLAITRDDRDLATLDAIFLQLLFNIMRIHLSEIDLVANIIEYRISLKQSLQSRHWHESKIEFEISLRTLAHHVP